MQIKAEYAALNRAEEDQAVSNMRENPKSFFSFAKSRQKTRSRIGPFIDPSTGSPNPDPDFAASVLSEQYRSVFVEPRQEWLVGNVDEFFATASASNVLTDIDFSESDINIACQELLLLQVLI